MLSPRRVSIATMMVVIAVLAAFIAPFSVNAQDSTPAACDASFGTDAGTVFQNVSAAMGASNVQAADFAAMAVDLAMIRHKYEDVTAPAGCEATRKALVQVAALDGDVVFLNLIARLDTKNSALYTDFLQYTWKPRFDAFKLSLAATPTPAATPASTEASASGVCADAKYQTQVTTDLKNMPTPDMSNAAAMSTYGLAVLKLRYQYEDTAAPAGCEAARQDMIKVLAVGQDLLIVGAGVLADSAKASTYTDFGTKVLTPRGQKLYTSLLTNLGTASPTPEPTEES